MNAQSSDEEIQRAVAEEMGWAWFKSKSFGTVTFSRGCPKTLDGIGWEACEAPANPNSYSAWAPPFHLSLDACAEFEKDAPEEYWLILADSANKYVGVYQDDDYLAFQEWLAIAKATPRQRCIAFLTWKGRIK